MRPKVTMYGSRECPYCNRAEQLLRSKGVRDLARIAVDTDPGGRQRMIAQTGRSSVPQIFVGDTHVGGFDDLVALERSGRLDGLLGLQSRTVTRNDT